MHNHKSEVEKILKQMPSIEELYDLADLFKIFSDSTRIRILYTMYENPMCVCGIADILEISQSAVSHQLRILKAAKLVSNKRQGKQIFYSLNDDHIKTILGSGLEHVNE